MHTAAGKRRAHRYEIRTDIRFRPVAVQNWHFGETENISDTGLLVSAPEALPVDTPIQLELYAPAPLSGAAQVPLACSGRVVRSMRAGGEKGAVRLAIAVQSGHIQPAMSQQAPTPNPRFTETFHVLNNKLAIVVGTAELLLASGQFDDVTVSRLRKVKDVTLEAASTFKKLLT